MRQTGRSAELSWAVCISAAQGMTRNSSILTLVPDSVDLQVCSSSSLRTGSSIGFTSAHLSLHVSNCCCSCLERHIQLLLLLCRLDVAQHLLHIELPSALRTEHQAKASEVPGAAHVLTSVHTACNACATWCPPPLRPEELSCSPASPAAVRAACGVSRPAKPCLSAAEPPARVQSAPHQPSLSLPNTGSLWGAVFVVAIKQPFENTVGLLAQQTAHNGPAARGPQGAPIASAHSPAFCAAS